MNGGGEGWELSGRKKNRNKEKTKHQRRGHRDKSAEDEGAGRKDKLVLWWFAPGVYVEVLCLTEEAGTLKMANFLNAACVPRGE